MRKLFTCVGLVLLMSSTTVLAQQSSQDSDVLTRVVDIPPYPKFMDACIGSFVANSETPNQYPNDKQLIAYSMLCQCTLDDLTPLGRFGAQQYEQSANRCLIRAQSDASQFSQDFGQRTYENVKKYAEQEQQEQE